MTKKNKRISVAVVEDDSEVRRSLVGILGRESSIVCAGEFANAEQALASIPKLNPNVVLMDINLPGMDGVECVHRLSALVPDAQIVMLTVYNNTEAIFDSLSAGASGYLLKPVTAEQLLAAVRDVFAGGAPMTSNIVRKLVQTFKKPVPAEKQFENLSTREEEVLALLAKGYFYKEIASHLNISYGTVHTYIERIFTKLHVRGRGQAVAKYLKA